MSIRNISDFIVRYFERTGQKYLILQGLLRGALNNFVKPIINPSTTWDFEKNPVFTPYGVIKDCFIVISENKPNFYNVQIIFSDDGNNILEIGTAVLISGELIVTMTEEQYVVGKLTLIGKRFQFNRVCNNGKPFIDYGLFNYSTKFEFEKTTGIKLI